MRHIPKPSLTVAQVYADCVSTVDNITLRNRLDGCTHLILDAESEFENKITTGQVFTIIQEKIINGNVTAEELKKVYTYRMVGLPIGRAYYNELILSAPQNICPYCSQRDVDTLDHYLPKALYPRLVVTPVNLVPSCTPCNKGKLIDYPCQPEDETLHPYYDNIENDFWLKASVNKTTPITIDFSVKRVEGWSDLLFARVKKHFQCYHLKTLYSTNAGRELTGRKGYLIKTYNSGAGAVGISQILSNEADSWAIAHRNSWKTALYSALAGDEWFCDQGFLQI
jgi:hypothetical protein